MEFLVLFILVAFFCIYNHAANEAFENDEKFDDELKNIRFDCVFK